MQLVIRDDPGAVAYITSGNRPNSVEVTISTDHLQNVADDPDGSVEEEVKGILYHEMTHMYQQDDSDGGGADIGLIEGIADSVRFKNGFVPRGAQPNKDGNWNDGYRTTAFFLLWLEQRYDSFIYELNLSMSNTDGERWTPDAFETITGQSVDELWEAYVESDETPQLPVPEPEPEPPMPEEPSAPEPEPEEPTAPEPELEEPTVPEPEPEEPSAPEPEPEEPSAPEPEPEEPSVPETDGGDGSELSRVCTPEITLDIQDAARGDLFLDVAGSDPEAFLQNIGREVCATMYRQASEVRRQDPDTDEPPGLQLVIRDDPGAVAYITSGNRPNSVEVTISTDHLQNVADEPDGSVEEEVKGILYHEMTHMYQQDDSDGGGADGGLIEGIADSVRFKNGFVPRGAQPNKDGNWNDGYRTTAFFLLWLEQRYDSFIYELNLSMSNTDGERWTPDAFETITGKPVDELWNDYVADDQVARTTR